MVKSAHWRVRHAFKQLLLWLAIVCGIPAATITQAWASASCTAVNGGAFNIGSSALAPANSALLTNWSVGDRIFVSFTNLGPIGVHDDGLFHGPLTIAGFGPLSVVSVPASGSANLPTYTVVASDLTNGIMVDPENNDSVTATCTQAPPTVTSVSPNTGSAIGGTSVTITGTNLDNATAVAFGANAATNVVVVNATSITAASPAGVGTVHVTVTTPGGTSATSSADQFTYLPSDAVPWTSGVAITTVDQAGVLGSGLSGLDYEGTGTATPGVLWAVNSDSSKLERLLWNGTLWVRDTTNGWTSGKTLNFPGSGLPDSEGVALTAAGAAGGVFVASERDLSAPSQSRISVLRYDVSGASASLTATREWDLTSNLPSVSADAGAKAVAWVPDTYLVGNGLIDQTTNQLYNPANYPDHGTGLFLVGLEGNGTVYAYALNQNASTFTRITSFASGLPAIAALHWDNDRGQLWVVCDNTCDGRSGVFEVNSNGSFLISAEYSRPTGMPNLDNEGFAFTPDGECVGGIKPAYWADNGNTGNHALRAGSIACKPPIGPAGWSAPTTAKGDFNGDGFGDLAVGVPGENSSAGAIHVLYGSASGIDTVGAQFWSQDSTGIDDDAEAGDEFGRALAVGNFNGDGFNDLAIGVPGENTGAGIVHVLYGSASGLTATGSQVWSQASSGVGDDAEPGDHFGATLAAGNLNSSTAAHELAIGVPDEDLGTWTNAGIVHVLNGGTTGLKSSGSQIWSQYSPGITDNPEADDRFGSSLAVGSLDSDTAADLAVGVPEEDGGTTYDYGVVHVLLGSATGLSATGSSVWSQGSAGIGDNPETGDAFGASLTIGNVGGSTFGDLIVGVPGESIGAARNAGMIQVIFGSASGPTGTGSQTFHQNTSGMTDNSEEDDEFGYALAVANFGGDANLDVAIGVPGESGANPHYGAVQLLPGSASGLTATGSQLWTQNSTDVGDGAEANDRFGAALTAGNYRNASFWDLAIGAPGETILSAVSAGIVHVLPGTATFLTGTGSKTFSQDSAGIADDAEAFDEMGLSLGR